MMKKFLIDLLKFVIPIALFIFFPSTFLYFSGENFKRIDTYISSDKNYLIGYAYNQENYRFLKQIELQNKDSISIIALGSSRVLQFRQQMFNQPFYNAGYTISSIADFLPFVEFHLKNKKPNILIIGLDQWMFNEDWDDLANYSNTNEPKDYSFKYKPTIKTLFSVWFDIISRKYGVEILKNDLKNSNLSKIGLNAIVNNKGFKKDGSFYYGDQIEKLIKKDSTVDDFEYFDTYSRIAKGNRRFQFGENINSKSLEALNDFLTYCKSRDIYIVAFLPPYANAVNLKMKQTGKYTYLNQIYPEANKLFEKFNFELWDLSDLNTFNSNDSETIDGFHGGEVSYLKMLIYMIEYGSSLSTVCDIQKLKLDLENKENNYTVYLDI